MRSEMAIGAGLSSSLIPRSSPLNIALFAGEYSGDVQGAALAAALRERCLEMESGVRGHGSGANASAGPYTLHPTPYTPSLWGIGGSRMREAGVELRFD